MKKYLLVSSVLLSFLLTGCFATHSGYLNNSASLSQANFKYVKRSITGESIATTVLGIGGLGRENMVAEAKSDMLRGINLKPNQTIANSTVSWKNSFYLGLFITNKCTVTADVIEFVKEGEEVVDSNITPVVYAKLTTAIAAVPVKVEEPKTTNSFTDINGTKWVAESDLEVATFKFKKNASLDVSNEDEMSNTHSQFTYNYSEGKLYLKNNFIDEEVDIEVSGDKFVFRNIIFVKK